MAPARSLWTDPRVRGATFQALALAAAVGLVWAAASNAAEQLTRLGIASGFGFLERTAGFDIIQHLIPYTEQSTYFDVLVVGLLNTLLVAAIGIVLATVIGFAAGIGQLSGNWLVARLCGAYVETIRNIPLLLQIFFWYFAVLRSLPAPRQSVELLGAAYLNNRGLYVPRAQFLDGFEWTLLALAASCAAAFALRWQARQVRLREGREISIARWAWPAAALAPALVFAATGFPVAFDFPALTGFNFTGGVMIIPELLALVTALSVYTGAYIADIVRAGILGVPSGQREAAAALGLKRGQALRLVVIPQAARIMIPPLTSQFLNLTKNSSLAVAIGYPDLVSVFAGITLNQTGQAIEVLFITMLVYLTLSLLTSAFMNWWNARMALKER